MLPYKMKGVTSMELSQKILKDIDSHWQEAYDLLLTLARIPAPSNDEKRRAEFCRAWLEAQGAKGVYMDEAQNVIYPVGCQGDGPIAVYMAHSDVVFPDMEPLPIKVEHGRIHCPGVGDDTANVVPLLMAAKYIAQNRLPPRQGVLLVVNAGEEGLGNLKGCRKIMDDFGSRVRSFVTFDAASCHGVNRAVGSRRYQVTVRTQGGHSYRDFGRPNAIAWLCALIGTLYDAQVPEKGKTTFNVGLIQGGTSVNTIAQQARMLYEFRSDERESLAAMEAYFQGTLARYRAKGLCVEAELVGDRPCSGNVDEEAQRALMDRAAEAVLRHFVEQTVYGPGSTDCNIPLSLGIPAVCVGLTRGEGAHTRQEFVEISSLLPGLQVAFELILHHF